MSDLTVSCSTCSVCWLGGVARHPRILGINQPSHVPNAPILVIDDQPHEPIEVPGDKGGWVLVGDPEHYPTNYWDRMTGLRRALNEMLGDIPYTYCQAVRCEPLVLTDSHINPAVACAVWTHNLTSNRAVILTGKLGFNQMKLKADFELFRMYRSPRLGIIFTIPMIDEMTDSIIGECKTRLQKALKEAKLL